MAWSIVSSVPASAVSAASRSTSALVASLRTTTSATASSFLVMVPVLSAHRTSTPAISSTAGRWLTTASCLASSRAPTAIVTDRTAGRATGIEAIVTTNANSRVLVRPVPRTSETTTMTVTRESARTMRYLPMRRTASWKWLTGA